MSKVFVGNLSFDTTREELESLFAQAGEIAEVFVPTDRDSGRPRGFAFVTFASAESATKAIQTLDGVELGGRNLRVNEATERTDRPAVRWWWRRWRRLSARGTTRPALAAQGQPAQRSQPQAQHLVDPSRDHLPGRVGAGFSARRNLGAGSGHSDM